MASSVSRSLDGLKGKPLSMGSESLRVQGEAIGRDLSSEAVLKAIGRVVGRAMAIGCIEPKDLAFRCGYANSSPVSKWIYGHEAPPLLKLLALADFRRAFWIAMAEFDGEAEVETTVRVRRKVG